MGHLAAVRTAFRHPPLAFWTAALAVMTALLLALAAVPPAGPLAERPDRSEVLAVRTELAIIASLVRVGDPTASDVARELAERVDRHPTLRGRWKDAARVLSSELRTLADLISDDASPAELSAQLSRVLAAGDALAGASWD